MYPFTVGLGSMASIELKHIETLEGRLNVKSIESKPWINDDGFSQCVSFHWFSTRFLMSRMLISSFPYLHNFSYCICETPTCHVMLSCSINTPAICRPFCVQRKRCLSGLCELGYEPKLSHFLGTWPW